MFLLWGHCWIFGMEVAFTFLPSSFRADLPEIMPKAGFVSRNCTGGELEHSLPLWKIRIPTWRAQAGGLDLVYLITYLPKKVVCRLPSGVQALFHPEILTGNVKHVPSRAAWDWRIPVSSHSAGNTLQKKWEQLWCTADLLISGLLK